MEHQHAVTKAKEDGDSEFEVDGKTYKVSEDWSKIAEVECPRLWSLPMRGSKLLRRR